LALQSVIRILENLPFKTQLKILYIQRKTITFNKTIGMGLFQKRSTINTLPFKTRAPQTQQRPGGNKSDPCKKKQLSLKI